MSTDAIIVIVVIIAAIVLFISEKLSVDLVAIMIMSVLVLTKVITPEEGVAGFSNPATITVACMFAISAALFKTGTMNLVAPRLGYLFKKNAFLGFASLMIFAGFISAFINNTPVVAVFIPIVIQASSMSNQSASKYLIPLSFATIFGGVCSLIGTSTNILVSGIAEQNGLPAFGMFQMTPMGLVFFTVGMVYLLFVGRHLLPDIKSEKDLAKKFGVREYLTDIVLLEDAPSVGKKIMDSPLVDELELEIIQVSRNGNTFILPPLDFVLMPHDRLKVRCNVEKIKTLKDRIKIQVKPYLQIGEDDLQGPDTSLVELVIPANTEIEGKTLKEIEFKRTYRAVALAIKHRNEILYENLNDTVLQAGDVLLAEVKNHRLLELREMEARQESPFIIISEADMLGFRNKKSIFVIFVIFGIISSAALDIVPIMVGSIAGTALLVASNCITMKDVYEVIDWKVVFLLAGALSLGVAMNKSGVADLIANGLITYLGGWGPIAILSGLYLVTSLLTEIMSNNATAALLTPVAIVTATHLEVSPLPFLMTITFAASASFMTPIGYQTNTMVYGAGQYKFGDFFKVGVFLNIIFWILATLLIPVFYPF